MGPSLGHIRESGKKHEKQKKVAGYVVSLVMDSLDQFAQEERKRRLKDIRHILTSAGRMAS
jgi:transcriptional regulator of met regulon